MPPNWKAGISTKIELAERIGDAGVVFEPRQRTGVQIEQGVAIARDFLASVSR